MRRALFYGISLAVIAWAMVVVPMPLVEFSPGGATPIPPLIDVSGVTDVETTDINGQLSLLTVRVDQPNFVETVIDWTTGVDLQNRRNVIPSGIEQEEYFRLQRLQFARAFELAAAVGLRAAGFDVEVNDAPVVFSVLPGGPSDGRLETGDVILALDGTPVASSEELIAELQDAQEGERLELRIRRNGDEVDVVVEAGPVPDLERPGLGVLVMTVAGDIRLPFPIQLEATSIGGPSAGMMTALTVYDLFSAEDLAAGRVIAGTGTIDAEGRVGAIGGIEEKVVAAERAGVEILLIPASQRGEVDDVPPGIELVAVNTLQEAIDALRR